MATHMTEKDLARANLKVNNDGTALVPVNAGDDLAILTKPPTLVVMPGTEEVVVRPTLPDAEWSLSDLVQYARDRLCGVPVSIFQAGLALRLSRDQFKKERAWGKWLKEHGIPRTSAWEAIQLFEKAKTEESVANMTRSQALKKFDVRPIRRKAKGSPSGSGGASDAAGGGEKPPRPSVPAPSPGGVPPKETSLMLFWTKVEAVVEDNYPMVVDWGKEDLSTVAALIMSIIDTLHEKVGEVVDHDLRRAS